MPFSDKQIYEAINSNTVVKDCFTKISEACRELQRKTDCPDDDIDRFLEFSIGKWDDFQ